MLGFADFGDPSRGVRIPGQPRFGWAGRGPVRDRPREACMAACFENGSVLPRFKVHCFTSQGPTLVTLHSHCMLLHPSPLPLMPLSLSLSPSLPRSLCDSACLCLALSLSLSLSVSLQPALPTVFPPLSLTDTPHSSPPRAPRSRL